MCLHFVVASLGVDVGLLVAATIAIAGVILTAIPITPAGLGAVETGMLGLFVVVGVPETMAVIVVFFYRLISYWSLVVLGAADYVFKVAGKRI